MQRFGSIWQQYGPATVTLVLLAGVLASQWQTDDAAAEVAARARLAEMAAAVPGSSGPWIGSDKPAAAPAAVSVGQVRVVSRSYENVATGRQVGLVVVWANDRRDLVGYDPPRWYRARGWGLVQARTRLLTVQGEAVPVTEYELSGAGAGRPEVLLSSFVVDPEGQLVATLAQAQSLMEDAPDGGRHAAALVQVEFPGDMSARERAQVVEALISPAILSIKDVDQERYDE